MKRLFLFSLPNIGWRDRSRTCDYSPTQAKPLSAKTQGVALPSPFNPQHSIHFYFSLPNIGRRDRSRTCNPRFWRPVLYQLSYSPIRNPKASLGLLKPWGAVSRAKFGSFAPSLSCSLSDHHMGGLIARSPFNPNRSRSGIYPCPLFCLLVRGVLAAGAAKLAPLKAIRGLRFIFFGGVIPVFTDRALHLNDTAHILPTNPIR